MKRIWDARFQSPLSEHYHAIMTSFPLDKELLKYEIWASAAHIHTLVEKGEIPKTAACKIIYCLKEVMSNTEMILEADNEDIHTCVEKYLIDKIGIDDAGYISTGRSRNTQVNVVTRLYLRNEMLLIKLHLQELMIKMQKTAMETYDWPMVGTTHCQPAQLITVGFWINSYLAAFERCSNRIDMELSMLEENFSGGGALAGTSFQYNTNLSNKLLSFHKKGINALDGVSGQDFNIGVQMVVVQCAEILSRLLSEIIHFAMPSLGYLRLHDQIGMGSSYMPQKKNPSVFEIMRGKCARIYGMLMATLADIHGLESGYNRDFQILKENCCYSLIEMNEILKTLSFAWEDLKFERDRFAAPTQNHGIFMAECANYVSKEAKISFRMAYQVVGQAFARNNTIDDIVTSIAKDSAVSNKLNVQHMMELFVPTIVLTRYQGDASSNPQSVLKMAQIVGERLKNQMNLCKKRIQETQDAFEETFRIS